MYIQASLRKSEILRYYSTGTASFAREYSKNALICIFFNTTVLVVVCEGMTLEHSPAFLRNTGSCLHPHLLSEDLDTAFCGTNRFLE